MPPAKPRFRQQHGRHERDHQRGAKQDEPKLHAAGPRNPLTSSYISADRIADASRWLLRASGQTTFSESQPYVRNALGNTRYNVTG